MCQHRYATCILHGSGASSLLAVLVTQTKRPITKSSSTERKPGCTFSHREGVRLVPRSGDVIHVTREASVQFASPMLFRVIRVHDWSTYDGWTWLDGYELNSAGEAIDRRSIFVQVAGLQRAHLAGARFAPPRSRASLGIAALGGRR